MIDEEKLLERFLRYVSIDTASDRHARTIPTTETQAAFARVLAGELKALGARSVDVTDNAFVIGRFESAAGGERRAPVIGLMAHMDTTGEVPGRGVHPIVHRQYGGKPIALRDGLVLDPAEFPALASHTADTVITSDGTTLLGADDKAGIAIIMTAMEHMAHRPALPHCAVEVIFTPDEETGLAMPQFPRDLVTCAACYTVDGSEEGTIEAECFEAYRVKVAFQGRSIHLGLARGKLVNAVEMAGTFLGMLPRAESPQATDSRYGYYSPLEIKGDLEKAELEVFIRDFEESECRRRVDALGAMGAAVEAAHPGGHVRLEASKQYSNMRRRLEEHPRVLELLRRAIAAAGLSPQEKPIRGGTDGARLTELGIPTPNIFTGGYNFHSRLEWASLSGMAKSAETLVHLAGLWAGERLPAAH